MKTYIVRKMTWSGLFSGNVCCTTDESKARNYLVSNEYNPKNNDGYYYLVEVWVNEEKIETLDRCSTMGHEWINIYEGQEDEYECCGLCEEVKEVY